MVTLAYYLGTLYSYCHKKKLSDILGCCVAPLPSPPYPIRKLNYITPGPPFLPFSHSFTLLFLFLSLLYIYTHYYFPIYFHVISCYTPASPPPLYYPLHHVSPSYVYHYNLHTNYDLTWIIYMYIVWQTVYDNMTMTISHMTKWLMTEWHSAVYY